MGKILSASKETRINPIPKKKTEGDVDGLIFSFNRILSVCYLLVIVVTEFALRSELENDSSGSGSSTWPLGRNS